MVTSQYYQTLIQVNTYGHYLTDPQSRHTRRTRHEQKRKTVPSGQEQNIRFVQEVVGGDQHQNSHDQR